MKMIFRNIYIMRGLVLLFFTVFLATFNVGCKKSSNVSVSDKRSLSFTIKIDLPAILTENNIEYTYIPEGNDEPPYFDFPPMEVILLVDDLKYSGRRIFIQAEDKWTTIDVLERTISPQEVEYMINNHLEITIDLNNLQGGHWELYDKGRKRQGMKPSLQGKERKICISPGYHLLKISIPVRSVNKQ